MASADELATKLLAAEVPSPLPAVELLVIDGLDRGARAKVGPAGARVGTGASAHLRLRDPTVSRIHCEIRLRPGGVRVSDAGSTNGTWVDAMRVRDVELSAGARLRLGGTTVEVTFGQSPLQVPISSRDHLGDLLGASVEMRRIYAILERVAPTDATVLVQGETGTGKEVVARTVHALSERRERAFVAVDCGAIAGSLIESELFGHARGAFSGAVSDRRGLFEEADRGTLFLDEIGELPLGLQAKLLRALETREVRRVGENRARRVDVRLVAATNRSLTRSVNEGAFREDLYYRLAVVDVHVPPLRARRDDVRLLAAHFYERFRGAPGPVPPDLLSELLTRNWPGNVRELRNVIERAVSLQWQEGEAATTTPADAPLPPGIEALIPHDLPLKEARQVYTDRFESLYLRALLQRTHGNVTRAAERAGVNRRHLQRMLARLGVRSDEPGEGE
jgi:transcriptional regulator with GAF, ATPase, and Fis domain